MAPSFRYGAEAPGPESVRLSSGVMDSGLATAWRPGMTADVAPVTP